ncbi:triacylglycerol lipase OBL1 [Mercurialis annua]|uniref:triacylglycerol lipase OBL1 n=1 Tax=Mercurialis annua TaxID=3986 RepID=UPI00215E6C48|nr:triacylglycerol lipase OBL1 [Mercurialis annua]
MGTEIDGDERFKYLIVRPEKGGVMDLWRYMVMGDIGSGVRFLECSEERVMSREAADNRWVIIVSILVRKVLHVFGKPLEYTGFAIDFFLNVLSENGGFFGLFFNFIQGKVVIPQRGTDEFTSTIGQLDGRVDLYRAEKLLEHIDDSVPGEEHIKAEMGHRALMDLCIMASKLAYENAKVVRNVVVNHWKMHFVDFYDCWNDFQKENSTQVFIICDKPKDADLILISFRGTEPFDADDWSTDFDYSWFEIPKLGKVHMGFLEALGLGNRAKTATTFHHHLRKTKTNPNHSSGIDSEDTAESNADSDKEHSAWDQSSDSETASVPPDMVKKSAYYTVRRKLRRLLREHKNAEFVVTGHSLGGALAILFPTVLVLHEEMEMMQRLVGVYTFGQPRIGDMQLGKYMEAHLEHPYPKYFRIVYCNDLVPRLPYDDKTFLFKHFGVCLYYDSFYNEQRMDEEPDPNFFGLRYVVPLHLNAAWELIRSLMMGYTYGADYKEGWVSIMFRIIGLALPGVADHGPRDYVNSVRLGREPHPHLSSS